MCRYGGASPRSESELFQHPQAALVLGPDGDLDAMQAHDAEAESTANATAVGMMPDGESFVDPVADLSPPGGTPRSR